MIFEPQLLHKIKTIAFVGPSRNRKKLPSTNGSKSKKY